MVTRYICLRRLDVTYLILFSYNMLHISLFEGDHQKEIYVYNCTHFRRIDFFHVYCLTFDEIKFERRDQFSKFYLKNKQQKLQLFYIHTSDYFNNVIIEHENKTIKIPAKILFKINLSRSI